jgi:hypothetical protein
MAVEEIPIAALLFPAKRLLQMSEFHTPIFDLPGVTR